MKWHDGRDFTSDDVKFSFERASRSSTPHRGLRRLGQPHHYRVRPPHRRLHLPQPYAPLLQQLNVTEAPIIPKHIYDSCTYLATVASARPTRRRSAPGLKLEASLSFLGLGDPTVMSWGYLVSNAQRFLRVAWSMSIFPGLAIAVAVLGINLMSDALNDALAAYSKAPTRRLRTRRLLRAA